MKIEYTYEVVLIRDEDASSEQFERALAELAAQNGEDVSVNECDACEIDEDEE